jgi:hypothetical protein
MTLSDTFLEALVAVADTLPEPLVLPWPVSGNPGGFISFAKFTEWQAFVLRLRLPDDVPQALSHKFERAQKLYLLAWIDYDLIKEVRENPWSVASQLSSSAAGFGCGIRQRPRRASTIPRA